MVANVPFLLRVSLKIVASLQFKNRAPSSAYAAEATTKRKIALRVKDAPFNLIVFLWDWASIP